MDSLRQQYDAELTILANRAKMYDCGIVASFWGTGYFMMLNGKDCWGNVYKMPKLLIKKNKGQRPKRK